MTDQGPARWEILQSSVLGANKKFSQDRLLVRPVPGGGAVVLAVADGHGSAQHNRSHLGAYWAVEELAKCVLPFGRQVAQQERDPENWPALAEAAGWLRASICHRWRERARLHEANGPSDGAPGNGSASGPQNLIPYGSTLLGAVVSERLVFCWQLGDGEIVLIGDNGLHQLFDEGGEELGDATDSLCGPEPGRLMRVHWQPVSQLGARKLVLLNTDGLSKSFEDHSGYRKFAEDVYAKTGELGVPWVRERLGGWLERAAGFSGDDTTLVAAYAYD